MVLTRKLLAAVSLLVLAQQASGETLRDALVKAYETNPTLTGARAGQRATDETVTIAKANRLPGASATASYSENVETYPGSGPARRLSAGLSADVPLYSGGGLKNNLRSAQARVEAGRAGLRGTETDVFFSTVAAYMDVLRDQAIVGLNRSQVKLLEVNLEATKDRFEVGDITRTDVAQSEARLASARSALDGVESQLIASRERYIQVVGSEPIDLEQPPTLPNLPESVGQAVETALADNPDLLAVTKARKAAEYDVKSTKSQRLPRVSGVASASGGHFLGSLNSTVSPEGSHSVAVGVQASVPLFQGGALGAQVRQSQARLSQSMEQIIEVERGVIASTRASYASWRAANSVILSSEVGVKANTLALEGVRAENSVGTRSILDVLDAQQELLNAQVQLVSSQRNAYVAGFQMLAIMGKAEYKDLGLEGGTLYDPAINYARVTKTIWDWQTDAAPTTQATRTVDTTPQTPALTTNPK